MLNDYAKYSKELLEQIHKGAFITVKGKNETNTMTIGWGHIGVVWGKPVFIAYVRYSRYTYDILRQAKDYTINVPVNQDLKDALKIAGTESGRDIDKFKKAGLTLQKAHEVQSPIIKECKLHYECKLIYTQSHEPALLPEDVKAKHYQNHDTHIMFYGEILDTYMLADDDVK